MSSSESIVVGPLPVSYPHVFEAKPLQGVADSKPFFSVGLIASGEPLQQIIAMVQAHAQAAFPNGDFNTNARFRWPWEQVEASQDKNPDRATTFPGAYVVNCKAQAEYPPQVLDATQPRDANGNLKPFTNRALLQAGTHCYAIINCYDYRKGNNIGVACGINALVVTGESTPFKEGGGVDQTMLQNIPVTPMGQMPGVPMQSAAPQAAPQAAPMPGIPGQAPMPSPAPSAAPTPAPAAPGQPQMPPGVPPMNFNQ